MPVPSLVPPVPIYTELGWTTWTNPDPFAPADMRIWERQPVLVDIRTMFMPALIDMEQLEQINYNDLEYTSPTEINYS